MQLTEKTSLLPKSKSTGKKSNYVLVIHGGAGTMSRSSASPEVLAQYHAALKRSLNAGYAVLAEGGEAMDAVVAAVTSLEGNVIALVYHLHFLTS